MAMIGELKRGWDIRKSHYGLYMWDACVDCGKERWVRLVGNKPRSLRCNSCANKGKGNWEWKGGQPLSDGYIYVHYPTYPRANPNGYVKRAIVVLEAKLGRPMLPKMDSHHVNGIKDDDRPENLMEVSRSEHKRLHR